CSGGGLNYLLALKNKFTGEVPQSYGECKSLVRFRVSNNNLQGKLPERIFSLPGATIIDVAYNDLIGPISSNIGKARNLSELFL
ncbi:hypothetical protein PSY31_23495, partial [Shigella flexneri]|nr:hypothetical protein [Shigella flexneri]